VKAHKLLYCRLALDFERNLAILKVACVDLPSAQLCFKFVAMNVKPFFEHAQLTSADVFSHPRCFGALREALASLTTVDVEFFAMETQSMLHGISPPTGWGPGHPDTSCVMGFRLAVPESQAEEFRAKLQSICYAIRPAEEGMLYCSISINEANKWAYIRQSFNDAAGLLVRLRGACGVDWLRGAAEAKELDRFEVSGPSEEISRLRGPLESIRCSFFECAQEESLAWVVPRKALLLRQAQTAYSQDMAQKRLADCFRRMATEEGLASAAAAVASPSPTEPLEPEPPCAASGPSAVPPSGDDLQDPMVTVQGKESRPCPRGVGLGLRSLLPPRRGPPRCCSQPRPPDAALQRRWHRLGRQRC